MILPTNLHNSASQYFRTFLLLLVYYIYFEESARHSGSIKFLQHTSLNRLFTQATPVHDGKLCSEIVLYKILKTGLQSPQSLICLLFNYLQSLKYEDSSLIEPDLFAFGPTVNLPASNEPSRDIIRPVCVHLQHKLSVLREFAGLNRLHP